MDRRLNPGVVRSGKVEYTGVYSSFYVVGRYSHQNESSSSSKDIGGETKILYESGALPDSLINVLFHDPLAHP